MSVTVHLKLNDKIALVAHKGLRSEAILKMADCDVFLTKEHLEKIRKVVDEHLERGSVRDAN